ncbi:MAG: carboxypeptidase-like regulatory domain-containing protein [Bacteroidales bacterium]|nr:carboxypeptidase-like regulatory domain-containing protein [Bacteroidales bacterium]
MIKTKKNILTFLLIFIFSTSFSQTFTVKGKVIDSDTKEPLAFVNIVINGGKHGGTSDIDGKFNLSSDKNISILNFSYVGYFSQIYEVRGNEKNIIIELKKRVINLAEVIILPGINPANRIINNAIKNRDLNDPEKIKSFSYTSYEKMIFTVNKDSLEKIPENDSLSEGFKMKKFLKTKNLFLIENVYKRKFMYPDKNYKKVIASRISGLKNPLFTFLLSELQSFSFYKDMINISDKNYINPISKGSLKKYFFLIEDTTYSDSDTTFIISFRPKKNKNFDGLKGVISISTNKWAIKNVIAKPENDESGLSIKIQQKYEFIDNSHWFPVQLNTDILFNNIQVNDSTKSFKIVGVGKTYIYDIVLNPALVKKEFSNIEIEVDKNAHNKDQIFWDKYRTGSLTTKDKNTYHFIDSIGKAEHLDRKMKVFETFINGRIPFKYFDLNINKLLRYNDYEGLYLGVGAQTNESLSRNLILKGYYGYGFKDKKSKYGFNLSWLLNKKSDLKFSLSYSDDVTETGAVNDFAKESNFFNDDVLRSLFIKKMDKTQNQEIKISFRTLKYLKVNLALNNTKKTPGYLYNYLFNPGNPNILKTDFYFSDLSLGLRYAYKEKFIKNAYNKMSLGTNFPVIFFKYTKSLNNFLDGEYSYDRFDFKLKKSVYTKYLGKTSVTINAGYINGDVPYCNLYNGHGSYRFFSIMAPNSFATIRMNEFVSNKYFALFFSHDFGKLLFKTPKFQPEFAIVSNFAFGNLNNANRHLGVPVKTLNKGYFESGLLINNLLNMQIYNLGVAAFYRYGPYTFDNFHDNISLKITLKYTL